MNKIMKSGYTCILEKLSKTVQANKKRFAELIYIESYIKEASLVINQPASCLKELNKLCLALKNYSSEFYIYKLVLNGLERDIRRLERGRFKGNEVDYLGICLI